MKSKQKVVFSLALSLIVVGVSANVIFQKLRSGTSKAATVTNSSIETAVVHISGNHFVNGFGTTVRLIGVDVFSTSYACLKGEIESSSDPPLDQATINTMLAWHINAVRIPLNEDCWLGINGAPAASSGPAYVSAISNFVSLLNQNGIVAILDLHWGAPGTQLATAQETMADNDNAPTYWKSLAGYFKSDPGVLFDAYNEPESISWSCWLSGCQVNDKNFGTYKAAGMQDLVNAIRSTGASQPILLGGTSYAAQLTYWLQNEPSDPDHQLAASFHNYPDFECPTESCWDSTVVPVAAQVPVVTTELGDNECTPDFLSKYMAWADSHGVSYLGWSWNDLSNGCSSHLLSDIQGDPSTDGAVYKSYIAGLWQAGGIINFATNTAQPPSQGTSSPPTGGGGGSGSGGGGGSSGSSPTTGSGSTGSSKPKTGTSSSQSSTSSGKSGSTNSKSGTSSTTGSSSSNNSVQAQLNSSSKRKSTNTADEIQAISASVIVVILVVLAWLYWLLIHRPGYKLKITKTKPPFFFKVTKVARFGAESDPPTTFTPTNSSSL